MPVSGSHFTDSSREGCFSVRERLQGLLCRDVCKGYNLPCCMPALGTKGWRKGQKPTLSLRNGRWCKTPGREGLGGPQMTLEAHFGTVASSG